MAGQSGLFDVDERLQRLSDLGDRLETFGAAVDFELFRSELMRALAYSDAGKGGRRPFDPVMMFKLLVIQTVNTLSDERCEYLVNDRLSFMRFFGLGLSDRVPDARTIWLFREKLTKAGAIQPLFDRFEATLRAAGYIAMSGQIVDASLVAAPRQRNTQAEKADSRRGGCRRIGSASRPSCATRTVTHAGRSSSPKRSRAKIAACRGSIWPFRRSATAITSQSIAGSA